MSINILLIFDMHDLNLNGALFLKISFFFLSSLSPLTVIVSFKTIYASRQSYKADHNIEVLNLIFLLTEY